MTLRAPVAWKYIHMFGREARWAVISAACFKRSYRQPAMLTGKGFVYRGELSRFHIGPVRWGAVDPLYLINNHKLQLVRESLPWGGKNCRHSSSYSRP